MAESIPSIEEIQQRYVDICDFETLDELASRQLSERDFVWYKENFEEKQNKIAWRQSRTAPPHCLECS